VEYPDFSNSEDNKKSRPKGNQKMWPDFDNFFKFLALRLCAFA
jgi:hypothetical protein